MQRNDVVNVHEATAEFAIAFLKVDTADLTPRPVVLKASRTSPAAALIAIDLDS